MKVFHHAIKIVRIPLLLESLISVYYSLVYNHSSYDILLWRNSSYKGKAFIVQKRILRMTFSILPRSSCRPIFRDINILTLSSIFILYLRDNEPNIIHLSSFYNNSTRSEKTLFILKHRTKKYEMSLFIEV